MLKNVSHYSHITVVDLSLDHDWDSFLYALYMCKKHRSPMDKQAAERGSPRILLGKIAEDLPDSIPEAGKFFDVLREKLTDIFQPPISAILKTSSDKFDYSK